MTCGTYVEYMLIFAQCSTHILSNQQLYTSTQLHQLWSQVKLLASLSEKLRMVIVGTQ